MKLKSKPIVKYDGVDRYVFVNFVAEVPGLFFEGKPVRITLKQFKELKEPWKYQG